MTMKYTMVIADDEPVVLKSTELFLKKEFPNIEIVGMAENGIKLKEMLEAVKRQLKLTYDHAILSYVMSILGFLVAMILWGVMRSVLRQEAQYIPLGTIMALGLC